MNNTPTLPIEKALSYLRENISSNIWKEGETIPSTRTLGALIGCSSATIVKALALLKKEGLVSTASRQKARVGSEYRPRAIAQLRAESHRRVSVQLEQDILSGRYPATRPLPAIKELQIHYGVCYRTMRHALDSLAADGSLVPEKKSWRMPPLSSESSHATISFITMRGYSYMRSAVNQEQNLVTTLLERECAQRGLGLDVSEVDFYDWTDVRRMIASLNKKPPPLGFVFDIWWYTTVQSRQHHLELLDRMIATGTPVTILDELGDFELPLRYSSNPLIQVFRIDGEAAGERMARLQIGHGHRKVAYISPSHFFSWSQRRLAGIQERFVRAGFTDAVIPIVSSDIDVILLVIMALAEFDDKTLKAVISVGRTRRQADDQYQAVKQFKGGNVLRAIDRSAADSLRRDLRVLADLAKRPITREFFEAQVNAAMSNTAVRANGIILRPLFEKALSHREVTAWLCASDGTAFAAVNFLQEHGISVPDGISVSGFDNSPGYKPETGLTSYDFNVQSFVHHMLNFISRPPKQKINHRHSVFEVEGMVIERGTTRQRVPE